MGRVTFYSIEDSYLKILKQVSFQKKSFVRLGDGEIHIL